MVMKKSTRATFRTTLPRHFVGGGGGPELGNNEVLMAVRKVYIEWKVHHSIGHH